MTWIITQLTWLAFIFWNSSRTFWEALWAKEDWTILQCWASELAKRIDFQDIINDFAVKKAHAKLFAKTTLTFQDRSIVQTVICFFLIFDFYGVLTVVKKASKDFLLNQVAEVLTAIAEKSSIRNQRLYYLLFVLLVYFTYST